MKCPYCKNPAQRATGEDVYPHRPDLAERRFWVCTPCNARVGCKRGSWDALGTLANAELREARMEAHKKFDVLWKSGAMSRSGAYRWLGKQMGLSARRTHIGRFRMDQCERVIEIMGEEKANGGSAWPRS